MHIPTLMLVVSSDAHVQLHGCNPQFERCDVQLPSSFVSANELALKCRDLSVMCQLESAIGVDPHATPRLISRRLLVRLCCASPL